MCANPIIVRNLVAGPGAAQPNSEGGIYERPVWKMFRN